jgi:hypothetical protein
MKFFGPRSSAVALLLVACSPAGVDGDGLATGGSSASGGSVASGGASSGGATSGGATSGGTASGGATSGGASSGGAVSGGATSGGATSGGATSGGATSGGAMSGGAPSLDEIAESIVGLRIDDACVGDPPVSVGATCDHAMRTGAGFHQSKEATIGGTDGTTYDITIRVRGVVEPTNVVGGERPNTETISYMNMNFRKEPFTIGGMVPAEDTDYAQWRIIVSDPAEEYTLNDYQKVGHYIFELDYEVTIPVKANAKVTLDGLDANERLIMNYEDYAPEGVDPAVNHGQFIELDLVSVATQ